MTASAIWKKVRRLWVIGGAAAGTVFITWSLLASRATSAGRAALGSDAEVAVTRSDAYWTFRPRQAAPRAGLLFFPGGMVDPVAYAPLAHHIAREGFVVLLVELPRRGAFGGADGPEVFDRARGAAAATAGVQRWVVAGHSRGGVVAANTVRNGLPGLAGLVLIGTSHPRDFSLASITIPVTRVFGTRDTVADVEKLERTRGNLPPSTRLVRIDGGNHSQFGYYGFQPGDWPATITREAQQAITRRALLDALAAAAPYH